MEMRIGAEVGLKKAAAYETPRVKLTENPAALPGSDQTNRQAEESRSQSQALKPTDGVQRYQLLGNTINMQA
ncbi:MAG: hypothetical protein K1X75_08180 [Leptospirales bacterium]|nr:hypothetical protein [Leptospirales bacterium]